MIPDNAYICKILIIDPDTGEIFFDIAEGAYADYFIHRHNDDYILRYAPEHSTRKAKSYNDALMRSSDDMIGIIIKNSRLNDFCSIHDIHKIATLEIDCAEARLHKGRVMCWKLWDKLTTVEYCIYSSTNGDALLNEYRKRSGVHYIHRCNDIDALRMQYKVLKELERDGWSP